MGKWKLTRLVELRSRRQRLDDVMLRRVRLLEQSQRVGSTRRARSRATTHGSRKPYTCLRVRALKAKATPSLFACRLIVRSSSSSCFLLWYSSNFLIICTPTHFYTYPLHFLLHFKFLIIVTQFIDYWIFFNSRCVWYFYLVLEALKYTSLKCLINTYSCGL